MNPQMNAPDRNEKFMLPDGMKKVSYEKDANVENAAKITLQREDHTVGNLIRGQLHRDKNVLFAGYKVPHPHSYKVEMKIQTKGESSPMQAYNLAIYDLKKELDTFRSFFGPPTESEEASKVEETGFGESGFGESGFGESGFGESGFGEMNTETDANDEGGWD